MVRWHGQSTCNEAGYCQWVAIQVYSASAASSVNTAHLPASQGEQALGLCLLWGKGRVKRMATCCLHGPDLPHLSTPSSPPLLGQTLRYFSYVLAARANFSMERAPTTETEAMGAQKNLSMMWQISWLFWTLWIQLVLNGEGAWLILAQSQPHQNQCLQRLNPAL